MSQDDFEDIKRHLAVLGKRMANQEKRHGLLVAVLTLVLVAIILVVLFL